jgi:hypothetical protein
MLESEIVINGVRYVRVEDKKNEASKFVAEDFVLENKGFEKLSLMNSKDGLGLISINFLKKEIMINSFNSFDSGHWGFEDGWKIVNNSKIKVVEN